MTDQGPREEHTARDLGPYGRLEISATTDTRCGNVLYRLDAPHVRGCVMFSPAASSDDPTLSDPKPSELLIHPDEFAPAFALLGTRPLSVNNILLTGPVRVAEDSADFRPVRRGKTGRPEWLPPRTHRHARAVLDAVVDLWRTRPDLDELNAAARRQAAQSYLPAYTAELSTRREELIRVSSAVARTERRLSTLHSLIAS